MRKTIHPSYSLLQTSSVRTYSESNSLKEKYWHKNYLQQKRRNSKGGYLRGHLKINNKRDINSSKLWFPTDIVPNQPEKKLSLSHEDFGFPRNDKNKRIGQYLYSPPRLRFSPQLVPLALERLDTIIKAMYVCTKVHTYVCTYILLSSFPMLFIPIFKRSK